MRVRPAATPPSCWRRARGELHKRSARKDWSWRWRPSHNPMRRSSARPRISCTTRCCCSRSRVYRCPRSCASSKRATQIAAPVPAITPPMASEHRITVVKRSRQLNLLSGRELIRTYPIALGRNSEADKSVEGDEATPLGEVYICAKNPRSRYFLSLCISYPNAEDAARGLAAGLISTAEHAQILDAMNARRMPPQNTRLGGEIYIHGHRDGDELQGTRGCIALNNADMQDL